MKEIKVPILPESINEATVAAWHKKPGDYIELDDVIVEIETDKVVLEVPAEESGVLTEISAEEGETVTEQQVLGLMDDEASSEDKKSSENQEEAPAQDEKTESSVDKNEPDEAQKADPKTHEETQESSQVSSPPAPETSTPKPSGNRMEERVPMTRIRKTIANKLHSATQNTAMLTTFNEVDMAPLMRLRSQYKDQFEKTHNGTRLGFMGFFVRACCEALKRFPEVNASIDGNDVVYHGYQDIGVAVSTEDGLVVPVLRDADFMSIADVEAAIRDLGLKARDKKLTIDEMTGGTFTVSNGGVFGSLLSTPILNPPQTAILGMHTIKDRPVAVDGEVVIRPMMYLALSYDHRLIDGKTAVQFLVTVKELIEDPSRILLQL